MTENEEEDIVEEDEPIPPLGWTIKVWYKPGCEFSVSHHRLMSLLQTYYSDWDAAVEYACEEHTHPLEDTYWKVRVCMLFASVFYSCIPVTVVCLKQAHESVM